MKKILVVLLIVLMLPGVVSAAWWQLDFSNKNVQEFEKVEPIIKNPVIVVEELKIESLDEEVAIEFFDTHIELLLKLENLLSLLVLPDLSQYK